MHYQLPECKDKNCPHCIDKIKKIKSLTNVVTNTLKVGDQVYIRKDLINYLDNKNINREENIHLKSYPITKVCPEDLNKYYVKTTDYSSSGYEYKDLVIIPTPKFKINDIVRLKINYNKWKIVSSFNLDPNRLDSNYKNYFLESVDDITLCITAFEYEIELYKPKPKRKFTWIPFLGS